MMNKVLELVKAMSRLGNGSELNPEFVSINIHTYTNTLGMGLASLAIKYQSNSSLANWLISKVIPGEKIMSLWSSTVMIDPKTPSSQKFKYFDKIVIELIDIDLEEVQGTPADKASAHSLFQQIRSGNRVAIAAVWVPMFFYFALRGGAKGYIVKRTISDLLVQYLGIERDIDEAKISKETMRLLAEAGLIDFVPVHLGFHAYDYRVGKEFKNNVIGWLNEPKETDISDTPLLERKRNWNQAKMDYQTGQKDAVALILEYRKVSETKNHKDYYLSENFVKENNDWLVEFLSKAQKLHAMDLIVSFGASYHKGGFGNSFKNFDGNKLFELAKILVEMAQEMPDEFADSAGSAIFQIQSFLKSAYDLEDTQKM